MKKFIGFLIIVVLVALVVLKVVLAILKMMPDIINGSVIFASVATAILLLSFFFGWVINKPEWLKTKKEKAIDKAVGYDEQSGKVFLKDNIN